MKKLLLILAAILILPIQICSAESVQVSDSKVWDFIDHCNRLLYKSYMNYRIEIVDTSPVQIGENFYIAYKGRPIDSVGVVFLTNRDGAISKILIISGESDAKIVGFLLNTLVTSIGLSSDEQNILYSSKSHSVWCLQSQRQIVVDMKNLSQSGFYSVEISAYK